MNYHKKTKLELRNDKPENVYRYIHNWKTVKSSHDDNARYLLIHALVQWGENRDYPINVFSIAIQYSNNIGQNVDLSQPAHIPEDDVELVMEEFNKFVKECKKVTK